MKHLTAKQILGFVDGSADYMTQATCTNHLATCDRCRKEVDLQKAILSSAKNAGYMMPSRSFTRRVMGSIVPSRLQQGSQWILNNMGTMFGMMAILGVTGSVIVGSKGEEGTRLALPSFDLSAGSEAASGLWDGFSELVEGALGAIALPQMTGEGNLVLIVTSVAALVLLDRLLKVRSRAVVKH